MAAGLAACTFVHTEHQARNGTVRPVINAPHMLHLAGFSTPSQNEEPAVSQRDGLATQRVEIWRCFSADPMHCNAPPYAAFGRHFYRITKMQRKCASAHHLRNAWTAADVRGKVGSHPRIWLIHDSPVLGTDSQFQCEGRLELH
jgi:hypothetical protein